MSAFSVKIVYFISWNFDVKQSVLLKTTFRCYFYSGYMCHYLGHQVLQIQCHSFYQQIIKMRVSIKELFSGLRIIICKRSTQWIREIHKRYMKWCVCILPSRVIEKLKIDHEILLKININKTLIFICVLEKFILNNIAMAMGEH